MLRCKLFTDIPLLFNKQQRIYLYNNLVFKYNKTEFN